MALVRINDFHVGLKLGETTRGVGVGMRELVEYVVKRLVDEPDKVEVTESELQKTIVIEVRVAPNDIGKVIGREGRMANALRTLVKATATKQGKNAMVDIID